MTFHKGDPRPAGAGRKPGQPNALTKTIRETFERVFEHLQKGEDTNLCAWAKSNLTDFYKLSAKLIPIEMAVQGGITLSVITGVPHEALPAPGVEEGEYVEITEDGSDLV